MRKSVASFSHKTVALCAALALAFSMAPLAWADDGPAGTIAGTVAGNAAEGVERPEDAAATESLDAQAPEASTQSADAKVAEGSSAGGTTVSIAVYRSSFPIAKWDLNDDDFNLTKAVWENRPADPALPQQASPGSEVAWPESGKPAGYEEPTRAGFEFAGWSTDKSASAGGYIDGSSPKLTMPEGAPTSDPKAYTLYALWTPNEYSVVFDLAKNPEPKKGPGDDASFDLKWASSDGVRTVTDLGDGRYRVDGFTMEEAHYDPVTRTVGLPEPARSGYRFLGWSEPDGQSLAIDDAAKTGYAMNPVRLTQIDGTPVLTARWTSAFGVTAPLSITFGDYDKTGAPGNPWLGDEDEAAADDTTQAQQDKEGAGEQEGYAKGGQAFFENTSWHEAVKLVGLTSTRHANANQVLTTYDTSKASEAQVLGDDTEENPGERLLSLYPSTPAPTDDKSSGIHFRLTDTVTEATLEDAFTMAPQGEEGARKDISYGLNLATDPVDGSANHGLVLPTDDYERKQIATVSYTFATATAASEDPVNENYFWTVDDNGTRRVGPLEIKRDAELIASGDAATISKYTAWLNEDHPFYLRWYDQGLTESEGGYAQGRFSVYRVRIIGINHDTLTTPQGGRTKAGLTFQFAELLKYPMRMNSTATSTGGWGSCAVRSALNTSSGAVRKQAPAAFLEDIKWVKKPYHNRSALTSISDSLFLVSLQELTGTIANFGGAYSGEGTRYAYWSKRTMPNKWNGHTGAVPSESLKMRVPGSTSPMPWWLRSSVSNVDGRFVSALANGGLYDVSASSTTTYLLPCFAM